MGTSGISTGFPVLSRSSGQVAHVLLTRSPLGLPRCCHRLDLARLACVKHAASVRPESGSNSPSRSRGSAARGEAPRSGEPAVGTTEPLGRLAQNGALSVQCIDSCAGAHASTPALAFGSPLFRFQGATVQRAHVSRGSGGAPL